jgi:hypothetical protein
MIIDCGSSGGIANKNGFKNCIEYYKLIVPEKLVGSYSLGDFILKILGIIIGKSFRIFFGIIIIPGICCVAVIYALLMLIAYGFEKLNEIKITIVEK